jgi:hypothetical protein
MAQATRYLSAVKRADSARRQSRDGGISQGTDKQIGIIITVIIFYILQ